MFQFAFVAELFKFNARGPPFVPAEQFANRRATALGDAGPLPCYLRLIKSKFPYLGEDPQTP